MRRQVELSGFITNTLDVPVRIGNDSLSYSVFRPAKECDSAAKSDRNETYFGEYDLGNGLHGSLNGLFSVFEPQNQVTLVETYGLKQLNYPVITSRKSAVPEYYIVSREIAILAMLKQWPTRDFLLIPAYSFYRGNDNLEYGFILGSLLREKPRMSNLGVKIAEM